MYSSAHLHQFLVESQFYPMYPDQALNDAFKMTDRHLLEKEDTQVFRHTLGCICIRLLPKDEKQNPETRLSRRPKKIIDFLYYLCFSLNEVEQLLFVYFGIKMKTCYILLGLGILKPF